MKVAIVGGGIAGLTTALSLHQQGLTPVILERAEAFGEVGAGLQLGPNAVRVLDALGLGQALRACADAPEALAIRSGYSSQAGLNIALGETAQARWNAPYLHIHRVDLIGLLAKAARERAIEVRFNALVTGVQETPGGAEVMLEGGSHVGADIVVAADGVRSNLRKSLWGDHEPVFAGSVAWRTTVGTSALGRHQPPSAATVWTGRGCHAVTYKVRGGSLTNLVAVVDTPTQAPQSWHEQGSSADVLAPFRGFNPSILKIIRKAEGLHKWGIYKQPLPPQWMQGRVCLIGDACHAMPPFLAQGAAMAIEDACILARALANAFTYQDGFKAYQSAREARVARVQEASLANGKRFHMTSTAQRMAAIGALGAADALAPGPLLKQFDWLYGYDAVSAAL